MTTNFKIHCYDCKEETPKSFFHCFKCEKCVPRQFIHCTRCNKCDNEHTWCKFCNKCGVFPPHIHCDRCTEQTELHVWCEKLGKCLDKRYYNSEGTRIADMNERIHPGLIEQFLKRK